ncbi:unnamed protein product [Protopolystoma xenopodis]|uniref:Uncharacterized protein n=1 Tax=Protopolystoma xenopodis TaxID=117903 RepID=A0A448XKI6_9PLAT|nr:unnamed protein product [Protopolystoma xenopodis]
MCLPLCLYVCLPQGACGKMCVSQCLGECACEEGVVVADLLWYDEGGGGRANEGVWCGVVWCGRGGADCCHYSGQPASGRKREKHSIGQMTRHALKQFSELSPPFRPTVCPTPLHSPPPQTAADRLPSRPSPAVPRLYPASFGHLHTSAVRPATTGRGLRRPGRDKQRLGNRLDLPELTYKPQGSNESVPAGPPQVPHHFAYYLINIFPPHSPGLASTGSSGAASQATAPVTVPPRPASLEHTLGPT